MGIRLCRTAAVMAAGLLVLAACGDDGKSSSSSPTTGSAGASGTTGAPATAPANYDPEAKITMAIAAPGQTFDPFLPKTLGENVYNSMVYDKLTEQNPDGTVGPALSKSWSFAPDGKSMTMVLRPDVTFHDGTKLDAATVKANIDMYKAAKGSPSALLSSIASVDVVDPTTVR